jgi:hypothetical protein
MCRTIFKTIFLILIVSTQILSQKAADYEATGKGFASQISAANLERNLRVIASDKMEGRETGSQGIRNTEAYITEQYKEYGIPPVGDGIKYRQEVAFTWLSWEDIGITVNDESYKHLWEFMAFQDQNNFLDRFTTNEITFLGYGIDDIAYSDYKGKFVKDKVVLIYKGEPTSNDGKRLLSGTSEASVWHNNVELKAKTAFKHGVKLLLIIEDDFRATLGENRRALFGSRVLLGTEEENKVEGRSNVCLISTNLAKKIIAEKLDEVIVAREEINEKGLPSSIVLPCKFEAVMEKKATTLNCANILGYIEGSDPDKKHEVIVISAHYDHLGKRGDDIYNGADDNGSGTVTVMEIARVLNLARKQGKGPARSVLALLVTGEEKGLLGSQFYATHPVFPLENTVANVNIDMVGRIDDIYKDDPNYIYVIGADKLSSQLHDINESVNEKHVGLKLDYTYNDEDDPNRFYYRSDHYNFAKNGIPAIFYFNGTHEDYHRPTDTIEKIYFPKMEKIAQLAFWVVWELANREERIYVDVVN